MFTECERKLKRKSARGWGGTAKKREEINLHLDKKLIIKQSC